MPAEQSQGEGRLNWLRKLTGGSAESAISLMLLGVCLAVGVAAWLLWPDTSAPVKEAAPASSKAAREAAADAEPGSSAAEQAALAAWQDRLEGTVSELEEQRRLREQAAELERRQREQAEAAARARRQREEQTRLEARRREAEKQRQRRAPSQPATQPKVEPEQDILEQVLARTPQPREPERVEASVDWSSCKPPKYPDSALRFGQEGITLLEFRLDSAGKVLSSRVVESSGYSKLDEAAETAIGKCRFRPATVDGTPEASVFQTRFVWKIEG